LEEARVMDRLGDLDAGTHRSRGYWSIVLRQLLHNRGAIVGAVILLCILFLGLAAPVVSPYPPTDITGELGLQPPNREHLMGTDNFGRDVFSRVIFGGRISMSVGFISVGIGAATGLILGLGAGYFGGWLDAFIMRMIDALLAFPGILLALAIVAVLQPSLRNVMVAVGISSVPRFTRVVRGSVLSARENLYVDAARCVGCSSLRIIYRHILPNVMGPVIILATLGIGGAILTGTSLSFLGLGASPPTPEWGLMLSSGRSYIGLAWWMTAFPGLAILITVLSVNMLGDGLRDALDPRLRM
jgi:peptide/nickel transport system permease protein